MPAAIATKGAILLTDGSSQDPETAQYLSQHPPTTRCATGAGFATGNGLADAPGGGVSAATCRVAGAGSPRPSSSAFFGGPVAVGADVIQAVESVG